MRWNPKKEFCSVEPKTTCKHEFTLAGCTLKKVHEAKYLGVTLTEEGVSDSKMVERIKKAKTLLV